MQTSPINDYIILYLQTTHNNPRSHRGGVCSMSGTSLYYTPNQCSLIAVTKIYHHKHKG